MKASIITLSLLTTVIAISGCKKNYICECTNPGGTYNATVFKDTKKNAKDKCTQYYNEHSSNVPFPETSCKIK
ncbi:MAG: hypothetical protein V4506_10635 [Bacteroidota bacterium]